MAENANVIRGINWRETFPFTNIFRAFRIAIHPSKLVLGLIALLIIYMGGRTLDAIWPAQSCAVPAIPAAAMLSGAGFDALNEVELYSQTLGRGEYSFAELRSARHDDIQKIYEEMLAQKFGDESVVKPDKAHDRALAVSGQDLADLRDLILKQRKAQVDDVQDQYNIARKNAQSDKERDDARDAYNTGCWAAYNQAVILNKRAGLIEGQGIFDQFFLYEISQVNQVADGVKCSNWVGDIQNAGVVPAVVRFLAVGPLWLVHAHTFYFIIFGIFFLAVWSIFGGAICRIAAVHIARDEKLSLRQALKFSSGKFLSFLFAPIIPLVIVVFVGFVVFLGGLVGCIPVIGPWIISILFFLALAAGFVMSLVLIGTIGGFNLMYPTVAVEGSDSFDAISRSFSYVYARPWRMIFYTIVAVIYGALTFLFVKLFITLMLYLTHYFVGKGMCVYTDSGIHRFNALWPTPSLTRRTYEVNFISLSGPEKIAAVILSFWVYTVISMIGAFAVSFYFSANTIIYYLMRREVDATELDDVYLEQSEEEFETQAAAAATATATAETSPPAPDAPPPPEAPNASAAPT